VLAGLKFDDVTQADGVVPDPTSMLVASVRTFDGLLVEITGFASEGKRYATFKAEVDGARAELAAKAAQLNAVADHQRAADDDVPAEQPAADAAKSSEPGPTPLAVSDPAAFQAERRRVIEDEAASLNRRTRGWAYVLPAYKYANMDKRLEDLLKPQG
jgi:hypothetical protein